MSFFTVTHQSKRPGSRARLSSIRTAHGIVQTPAFVPVATKGSIKSLTPQQVDDVGVQAAFVNSYHLVVHPGPQVIRSHGSIHTFSALSHTLLSDSGGFQVFSLARSAREGRLRDGSSALLVSLTDEHVLFRSLYDGSLIDFSPESSMQYQTDIGADLMMAFDECTYHGATHEYTKKSMDRTHTWLTRCLGYATSHARTDFPQYLYGVIQGGGYEDLRIQSARFVEQMGTPGVAIGGVSVGESKAEMRAQVAWVSKHLPDDRPVHLLGVGHRDDIIDLVGYGIDTFDCVEPTRLARMGVLLQSPTYELITSKSHEKQGSIDIHAHSYREDTRLVDSPSSSVRQYSYAYLHHLFKQREILGYTIATMHNLAVMERLMTMIRELIAGDKL